MSQERKPFYWLNDVSRLFLSRDYLRAGIEPEQRYRNIADRAEEILKIKGFADKFFDYLGRGYYSISTPVTTNFGYDHGLPISCNGSYIEDTMESILHKNGEVGIMSKYGAGTSGYFGAIRPRGSSIKNNGRSSGAVHFMKLFDTVADLVSQGASRRGSFAAYLPVEHEDIHEFLTIRDESHAIQNMSIGVTITNAWMRDLIGGDKEKRKIWGKIIEKRFATGYPYIMFVDNANDSAPQVYKDKSKKIYASNLCVAPETRVLTKDGYSTISKLAGKTVEIWNGKQWSNAAIAKTSEKSKLNRIDFADDNNNASMPIYSAGLWVTDYHKFYLKDGTEIAASDLKIGDELEYFTFPDGRLASPRVADINNQTGMYGVNFADSDITLIDGIRYDPTYCVNEPIEHKAVFNGILTGNCSEIMLSSSQDESFVCNLSSINLLHWDEIKETDAVETLIYFLDAVMTEYIDKTEKIPYMSAAYNFAKRQRALGLGVLGWHSYLQKNMIAFESFDAKMKNVEIWKTISERCNAATVELAKLFGEPELLRDYGRRNVTTIAVAPTVSSSTILGQVSPSIEILESNYFVSKKAKVSFTFQNPFLFPILENHGKNTDEVWESILHHGGSVQHLKFLTEHEKNVFKTFGETSQKEIVIQAAQRQKWIDQGQSLNLTIDKSARPKEVSSLLIFGWEQGIKSFYYQHGFNPAQQLARSLLACTSCEG